MSLRNDSGSAAMLVVMTLSAAFLYTLGTTFLRVETSSNTGGKVLFKKKAFYMAEGVTRVANKIIQNYLKTTPNPLASDLNTYLTTTLGTMSFAPYSIETAALSLNGAPGDLPLPNGPFAGMDSYQAPLSLTLRVRNSNNDSAAEISETAVLAKVALLQFALFSDLPSGTTYLAPGEPMTWRGRLHINGDFCVGNFSSVSSTLQLENVTASGRIFNIRDAGCWSGSPVPGVNQTYISKDSSFTSFALLKPGADNGCVGCDSTALNWKDYSMTTWQGNLQDSAQQVQQLKLQESASAQVQAGAMPDLSQVSNQGSSRFIVDPVMPGDSLDVASKKIAQQADIRIINGVWYLRNPVNPTSWPGLPIWSDHPGSFTALNEEGIEGTQAVGQEDIRALWQATAPWIAGQLPMRYSYYGYDIAAQNLKDSANGTISYGTLIHNASATPWKPGHYVAAGSPLFCQPFFSCSNCSDSQVLDALNASSVTCTGGTQPGISDFLANGARSGYRDGNVAAASWGTTADKKSRSFLFPVNFDVASFATALVDVGPGELGSYFGPGHLINRPFNGIIYVTSTWKDSLVGMGTGFPGDAPFQGAQADTTQLAAAHPGGQQALPMALCSANTMMPGGVAGASLTGAASRFKVPDCAKYAPTYMGLDRIDARPNVLRIHNAANLSPALFPSGLTIASNLPAYVLGDFNTSSNTSTATALPWIPTLIAADQVTLLSNNWNDANAQWNLALQAYPRIAVSTTYNVSLLTGGTTSTAVSWGAGVENLPRYIEQWSYSTPIQTAKIRGSMVQGFFSVYMHNPVGASNPPSLWAAATYEPPTRDFGFDNHLGLYKNMPPGTPSFDVYALKSWQSK